MRQAEEAGQFEETAAQTVRANLAQVPEMYNTQRAEYQQEKNSVALRLRPTNDNTTAAKVAHKKPLTKKNKAVKPPTKKKGQASPVSLPGISSRERKSI